MSGELAALRREVDGLSRRAGRLEGLAEALVRDHARARAELAGLQAFLDLAPAAQDRLEELSRELFGEILEEVETTLSHAVREILGQRRAVRSRRELKGGRMFIELEMDNDGRTEDILKGQGGSVCNILSVGLRLVGLAQLDPARHRPFLVLDEQDCWLRPELVPEFARIIAAIGESLGLQILYISHHGVDAFVPSATRIFKLTPDREQGVRVELLLDRTPSETKAAQTGDADL